jgi:hypothetical protein
MHNEEIEAIKIYSAKLTTPFSIRGVAFYETEDGKTLELIFSESITRKRKSEREEFESAWQQVINLNKEYSPNRIKGKILLESDTRIVVKSGERKYTFEKSDKKEMEKIKEYIRYFHSKKT